MPQSAQCAPSERPLSVHVGAMPLSITALCPVGGIVSCALKISPQAEQCLPSVSPGSLQVGATAGSIAST